ncbi:DUF4384 domain-containing protein [Deinococcus radiopugnans]|uniref:DUF4384 domain-containing protein n=1 Tax=Deinococcus radiopugnans ATCC 19172 TaxID=585398 RepID=A0A5C4Y9X0_9DEIO|nr:DUF4384 domain-containing protein [Deinococcus radiopugnans]MBB6015872.1 hypothetical protein [Deinococcus radiopugnans ATCC 19172]TNM72424.1 DUF4384 domain-containing protein [Deinococcus radiopugnans ATCC 19172]
MNPFPSLPKLALGLSVALVVGLGGPAHAAPKISAQSIIVNPVPTTVDVKVWTDRDSSGTRTPSYAPGERIRLYASVSQDAYVYLFNVDPGGQVDLILPNKYQGGANFLKANSVKVFPAAGDPFTFDIAAPYGLNKVLALASKTPLNLDQIATFKSGQNSFADVNVKGQQGLAQALSIVVTPVPQNTWDSATAFYQVVARRAAVPALPAQPVNPWGNARKWQVVVSVPSDLRALHDSYAARLKAEGYVQTKLKIKNNEIESEYRRGNDEAELQVKRKGNGVEIKLERD